MVVGLQHWDRSSALIDGRVRLPMTAIVGVPNRNAWEGLFSGAFDAAELPLARLVFNQGQGDPIVAIPVFPDRLFLQRYIYVRSDFDGHDLASLNGKRVIVPGYYFTASFWHRQMLREAGVAPEDVTWISTAPELDARMRPPVPVTVQPDGDRGVGHLLSGAGDVLMHEYTLPTPRGRENEMRRLFDNVFAVEGEWFKRTEVHPILHVVAVREESLRRRPDFGVELCRAFDEAKAEMYRWLQNERTTGLPFAREALDHSLEVMGDDPWAYGLERNAREINQFLDLAVADAVIKERPNIERLFDARSLEYRFTSRINRATWA